MIKLQVHVSTELFQTPLILPQKNQVLKALTGHLDENHFSSFPSPTMPELSKDKKRCCLVLVVFCIDPNMSLDTISPYFYQAMGFNDAPEKAPGGKESQLKTEKANSIMGLLLRKQNQDKIMLETNTDKKEMKIETTKKKKSSGWRQSKG